MVRPNLKQAKDQTMVRLVFIFVSLCCFACSSKGYFVKCGRRNSDELRVKKVKLQAFESCENNFSGVKLLDLTNCDLKKVPLKILEFSEVEVLLINNNSLEELPDFLCSLKKLRVISVYNNKLKDLPHCLLSSPLLEKVIVFDNDISYERRDSMIKNTSNAQLIFELTK